MSDLLYLAIFIACCVSTWGLIVLCDRLLPREAETRSKT